MERENWSVEDLALLARHGNQSVAELTGRDIEEVRARRLQRNIEINCWDKFDPERAHEAD
ncbi:hypothetical protein [Kosakonia sp. MUSA4]|uniref:hypothetical protein n=1 Tax=Kosakonia sp. MUSA4 TaxID=2067958 RepID=UPI0015981C4A|nr:hypothetical protein [Kosakonia sp. MUSA4]QJT80400.1 hypothetical protein C0557_10055 [Kosakonia sp. MUSA4]